MIGYNIGIAATLKGESREHYDYQTDHRRQRAKSQVYNQLLQGQNQAKTILTCTIVRICQLYSLVTTIGINALLGLKIYKQWQF